MARLMEGESVAAPSPFAPEWRTLTQAGAGAVAGDWKEAALAAKGDVAMAMEPPAYFKRSRRCTGLSPLRGWGWEFQVHRKAQFLCARILPYGWSRPDLCNCALIWRV